MYKLLLCLRYLKTRYIALACIVSVTLGVATMIVVNSVMAGFSHEMRDRLHELLADVVLETNSLDGQPDPEAHLRLIRETCGDDVEGMTATVEVYGMLSFQYLGQWITRPVTLIGIDPESKSTVGPLKEHLDSYKRKMRDGVVEREPLRGNDVPLGWELTAEARVHRAQAAEYIRRSLEGGPHGPGPRGGLGDDWHRFPEVDRVRLVDEPEGTRRTAESPDEGFDPSEFGPTEDQSGGFDPGEFDSSEFDSDEPNAGGFDSGELGTADAELEAEATNAADPFHGLELGPRDVPTTNGLDPAAPLKGRVYVGAGLISFPQEDPQTGRVETINMVRPGDDIKISTVTAGRPPNPVHFNATVVDVFKSGMSEYDSSLVFCNIDYLQEVRGMFSPETGTRSITSIQLKLRDYENAPAVIEKLRRTFPPGMWSIQTWEQKQGPLLAAVEVESAILNVLLFLIIAVAGFGILAIFYMIVVEKTRDIGILKALGASSRGVMSIFLGYGLALGIVGAGAGVVLGLTFVHYINEIEDFLTYVTGRPVFNETIYYFPAIPTSVSASMVLWVSLGAMLIAVLASILPARRAASLHPVEALRFE